MTCVALRRELEAHEDAQMCAQGDLSVRVPRRVGKLVDAAFRAARVAAGRWLAPGECLAIVAAHFVATWKEVLRDRNTLQHRVLERDRGECQVPGCSRAALHAHHVVFRSRGGADAPGNLVSLCAAHHLRGVHAGYLRVRGEAPHALSWELAAAQPLVH
jgi:5-methylcytosine-specific restriction endonuclease McrA